MLSTVILPWVHYVAVFVMIGALMVQMYLLKLSTVPDAVRSIARVDRIYGVAALLVFVTGLLRVWHGGKGADYYWHNGAFHGVIGLFILAALVSIVPTLRFIRWRKAVDAGALPAEGEARKTRMLVHVELSLIFIVALLITMVAKGYGGH
jgi:putative membrane protein